MLEIPYYVVNHQERFERDVIRPFVDEYLAGRTPIPCSLCNNHLKFDQLLLTARQIGAELIATGHYARNEYDEASGRWLLKRPADASKDQTYFLFGLTQEQLSRTLFPLGDLHKPAVREMAADAGLALAAKPDSQEICFIPGGSYSQFLKAYLDEQGRELPDSSGELVATGTGELLGHHEGIHGFTVGQRKGLYLDRPAPDGRPRYVLSIEPVSNTVTVGPADALGVREITAIRPVWTGCEPPSAPIECSVQLRAHGEVHPCTAWQEGPVVEIRLDDPARGVAAGQAAVLYDGDTVLGSATISATR